MKRSPLIAAVAVCAAAAAYWYFAMRAPAPPTESGPAVTGALPQAPAPEPTISAPAGTAAALPGLDESDAAVDEWLFGLVGREAVERFLVRDSIARKIVTTVDNLPRKKVDLRVRAIQPLPGAFVVERDDDGSRPGVATWARYEPLAQVVRSIEADKAAEVYVRLYPLLQQAYEELGYPGRQFHARVLAAIDDLLAAPAPDSPPTLVQPHVLYEFADPGLEARSAGQKIMLRIGPDNAALVRVKLEAFRAAIVARSTAPAG